MTFMPCQRCSGAVGLKVMKSKVFLSIFDLDMLIQFISLRISQVHKGQPLIIEALLVESIACIGLRICGAVLFRLLFIFVGE